MRKPESNAGRSMLCSSSSKKKKKKSFNYVDRARRETFRRKVNALSAFKRIKSDLNRPNFVPFDKWPAPGPRRKRTADLETSEPILMSLYKSLLPTRILYIVRRTRHRERREMPLGPRTSLKKTVSSFVR